jgi:hypothetical protein
MKNQSLPRRVFNSPLIEFANFADGSSINLIQLIKPYSNGDSFAVYHGSMNPVSKDRLFKNYESAKESFEDSVIKSSDLIHLVSKNQLSHNYIKP